MTAPGEILLQHERMGRWFFAALTLHVVVIGGVLIANWLQGHTETFGSKDAGGSAVGIEAVNTIPLQTHGPENRLATDTESEAPQTPPKPVERAKKEIPAPNAVPLKMKAPKKKLADIASEQSHIKKFSQLDPYKLTSKTAPALSSPEFAVTGSGRISPGAHNTFGDQFSAYGTQIQQLVASHWHTDTVDQSIHTAPTVIATFDLSRDGSVRNLHILQSSNIPPLDASVQRAILDSNPLPPLPAGFPHNTASVEFWFELKR